MQRRSVSARHTWAVASLRTATKLAPLGAEGYVALGLALCDAGRSKEAVAAHTVAYALNPADENGYSNLGAFIVNSEALMKKAVRVPKQALALAPANGQAAFNLAVCSGMPCCVQWHALLLCALVCLAVCSGMYTLITCRGAI